MRFSLYFETEEEYIEWKVQEEESETRRALHRVEARELKAARIARRPAMFSQHTVSTSASKERSDDGRSCAWVEVSVEPIVGMYIGYRYKFEGKWQPEPDGYDEPGEGYYFSQSKTVEVWLFVTHENRKPIMTFPFDVNDSEEEVER